PGMLLPSVDWPVPLGPMLACTSPGFTCSDRPLRMSRPPMEAWRLSILSMFGVRSLVCSLPRVRGRAGVGVCLVGLPPSALRAPAPARGQEVLLADRAFQAHVPQFLGFDRELQLQLLEDLLAEAVDDQARRVLLGKAAGAAVEQLVVADLRGGSLVLDGRAGVLHLDVGEG